jgi:MFS family permease
MNAPFQVTNPVVNATELYEQNMRLQRLQEIRKRVLTGLLIALFFLAVVFVRKVRVRWPFVTIMLYGIFFVLVLLPLLWGGFVSIANPGTGISSVSDLLEMYTALYGDPDLWPFWLLFAGLILAQGCLLMIPVQTAQERPKPRRGIWLTAIAAGFLYSVLLGGLIMSVLSAVTGDEWLDYSLWLLWLVLPANWILWMIIFRRFAKHLDPKSYTRRIVKWLMRGSILELLVAVPSHIIVRHKDVCCAHLTTAAGIAAGLAVMFLAFGPGLYYLYTDRINRKKPKATELNEHQAGNPQEK